ncbi:hypothetical protein RRF57_008618 [Xylaria bambusicola]|uniref:Uncharacterized protein n=1 Tax=Xylaria bambusicola TaxID=326684 RepID=A0AAN7USF5_9PEZI
MGLIITNDLNVLSLVEVAPSLPVVLGKGIFNAHNWVLLGQFTVKSSKLFVGDPLVGVTVGVLEVKVVFLHVRLVELAGGNIHSDVHTSSVASFFDSLSDEVKGLFGSLNIGGNTTLVSNVAGRLAILLLGKRLQLLVDLSTLTHGL